MPMHRLQIGGDSLARYLVRIREMRESVKIIQQALKIIKGGGGFREFKVLDLKLTIVFNKVNFQTHIVIMDPNSFESNF